MPVLAMTTFGSASASIRPFKLPDHVRYLHSNLLSQALQVSDAVNHPADDRVCEGRRLLLPSALDRDLFGQNIVLGIDEHGIRHQRERDFKIRRSAVPFDGR